MPPGDPAVDGAGAAIQGLVEQGLGGDVVVDQAEVLDLHRGGFQPAQTHFTERNDIDRSGDGSTTAKRHFVERQEGVELGQFVADVKRDAAIPLDPMAHVFLVIGVEATDRRITHRSGHPLAQHTRHDDGVRFVGVADGEVQHRQRQRPAARRRGVGNEAAVVVGAIDRGCTCADSAQALLETGELTGFGGIVAADEGVGPLLRLRLDFHVLAHSPRVAAFVAVDQNAVNVEVPGQREAHFCEVGQDAGPGRGGLVDGTERHVRRQTALAHVAIAATGSRFVGQRGPEIDSGGKQFDHRPHLRVGERLRVFGKGVGGHFLSLSAR